MSEATSLLLKAANFAAVRHRNQLRKDDASTPYINHPLRVAEVLTECGVDELPVLLAALLHDTVEDTATSFSEIESEFGFEVCDLVREVTDDKSLPKQRRKALQVEMAPQKSSLAKQLKIADKISNIGDLSLTSPVGWDMARKAEYLRWAESVVAGCAGVNPELDNRFQTTLAETKLCLGLTESDD